LTQERVTISIDSTILRRVDKTIDKKTIRNRSHAVESLIRQAFAEETVDFGVVLAGGEGIKTSLPFIEVAIKQLIEHDVTQFLVIYGYYGRSVHDYFGDGTGWNATFSYHETEQGSGGGLKEVVDRLPAHFAFINIEEHVAFDWPLILHYYQRFLPLATLYPSAKDTWRGVGIAQKDMVNYVPAGFSILEEQVLPELYKQGDVIYLPPLGA